MQTELLEFFRSTRQRFPALGRSVGDRPAVFFDGPAGTQVPDTVIRAVDEYFTTCNANHGGAFLTSRESDAMMRDAQRAFTEFLGVDDPDEIVFGANMTTLTFAFTRAVARTLGPGDEVVVTTLDHDANITPWVRAADDAGATVRWVEFEPVECRLRMDQMVDVINDRTRWVAVGAASNATGGINPVAEVCELAHRVGAKVFVDAVHYGPHGLIDVGGWDCDVVVCSAYKFFGPHLGILWGRRRILESLPAYKVRPASDQIPDRWMTGTPAFELIAGARACVEYLAELGRDDAEKVKTNGSIRDALAAAFTAIAQYERELVHRLISGLQDIPGIRVFGITDPNKLDQRFSTVSITHERVPASEIANRLADAGIFVWHGNYYALEWSTRLGLEPEGAVRIGLVHYNTPVEVDRLLTQLREMIAVKT